MRIAESTLKKMRRRGNGPPFSRPCGRPNGKIIYSRAKIDEYLLANEGREPGDFKPFRPASSR